MSSRTMNAAQTIKSDSNNILPERIKRRFPRAKILNFFALSFIVVLILAGALSAQLMAQGESCATCGDKYKARIRFASVICADKNINITLNGATASTPGGTCTQNNYATSNWTYTELKVDQTYTITAGTEICSTHILFDVPAGYNLEINGELTSEINKAGPYKGDGDGTWNLVLKKCKSCGGTPPGASCDFKNSSVEWSVGLGQLSDGRGAEAIAIREETLGAQIYTPAALIYSPPGKTSEVEVMRNPDGSLRQVKAPQALADIVTISSSEYEIRYYRPADIGNKVGGIYTTTGQPFTVWKIKNPDTSSTSRLQISKTQNGTTETSEYQSDSNAGTWTLVRNGGLRAETKFITYPAANARTETMIVKDNTTQLIASKTERTYYNFPWGDELIKEVVYPYDNSVSQAAAPQPDAEAANVLEVAPLVTDYAYYEDAGQGGSYSKLKSVKRADGSWEKYIYDNYGNISVQLRPWKDSTLENATDSNSHATYYYYTNFDGVATSLFNKVIDHIDENINGYRVKRTTYDRSATTINGEPAVREVETVNSMWQVGTATVSTRYHRTASGFYANRTAFVEYADGTKDSYIYERGDYATNADPSLNQFTPNPNGLSSRDSVIHGTVVAPDGVAFKTTKDTVVRDEKGQNVLNETYVYNGTGYERINWSVMNYDNQSHLVQTRRSNGTISSAVWNGDLLNSETDEGGVQTTYTYDLLNRTKTRTKKGVAAAGEFPAQADIVTTYVYDAEGRATGETITAAGSSLTLTKTKTYDLAGRTKSEKDEAGYITLYDYPNGGRTQKIIMPGGAYRISESYLDGRPKSQSGTAVISRFFDYGVNPNGTRYTKEFIGDAAANSPRWTKTTIDWAERTVQVEKPGFMTGANIIQTSVYDDNKGWLKSVSTFAGSNRVTADVFYEYDELGRQIRSGLDLNANGVLDVSSTDRIQETENFYEKTGSDWYRVKRSKNYLTDNSATAIAKSQKERLTFAPGALFNAEQISIDAAGQSTLVTNAVDRTAKKTTTTLDAPTSTTDAVEISINGLRQTSSPGTPQTATTYTYDALGRLVSTVSPQTGTDAQSYDASTGQIASRSQGNQTTTFQYYPPSHQNAGRTKSQTDAAGKKVYFEYNLRGEMVRTWGDATYPLQYVYDSYGQKAELHTYRGGKGWRLAGFPAGIAGTADITKWIYHEPTGLLNKKEDALGRQVIYAYDAANRLQSRTWARTDAAGGVQTVYAYHPDTGEMNGVNYSDSTPDVTMNFDRGGRAAAVTDAAGSRAMSYNVNGEIAGDEITGGILDGVNISIGFDEFLRRNSLQATRGTNTLISQTYGYDAGSRLETVTSGGRTATYGYYPTSGLLKSTTFTGGTNINRVYDSLGRMQSITNTPASGAAASYTYVYNNLNQRTRATREDGAYWSYNYNDRGELQSGRKYWSDNAPVAGQQFDFAYDNIGNRETVKNGGDSSGNNLRQSNYAANSLNQYSNRTVPGAVDVFGTSDAAATVTVNNQPTYRKGAYFQTVLNLNNSVNPVSAAVNVVGVKPNAGTGGEDAVEQKTGSVFLPATSESYNYDPDGNLLNDGRWQYAWDAENRLSSMTALSNVPTPAKKKLEFSYDYQGRRIQKKVYAWNVSAADYQLQSIRKFVYDGWNLIAELDGGSNNALLKNFVQAKQLLMIQTAAGEGYYTGYDANGNIVGLTQASSGKSAAQYDYNPFGETLQENGEAAQISPFRFSGKYTDAETNLVYYGYRYYNPQTGRWISRDPIKEKGGVNLYAFVKNDSINQTDILGLVTRGGVTNGTEEYSCHCGWLDWNHISVGSSSIEDLHRGPSNKPNSALSLWNKVQNPDLRPGSRTYNGYLVSQRADFLGGYAPDYTEGYFVRNGLNLEQKKSVALSIFMNFHNGKEQSTKAVEDFINADYNPLKYIISTSGSGFAEEDLPSNLISFYAAIYNYDRERITYLCKPIGMQASLELLSITGEGNRSTSWSPRNYNNKTSCCGNQPMLFNRFFSGINPVDRGDWWDIWNEKHESLRY